MFRSLLGILEDTVKIIEAPIEIAADITKAVTKPLADGAQAVSITVKQLTYHGDE